MPCEEPVLRRRRFYTRISTCTHVFIFCIIYFLFFLCEQAFVPIFSHCQYLRTDWKTQQCKSSMETSIIVISVYVVFIFFRNHLLQSPFETQH